MCGIVGIISKKETDAPMLLKRMLQAIQHGGVEKIGLSINGQRECSKTIQDLHFEDKKGFIALGHAGLTIAENMADTEPFQSKEEGRLTLLLSGKIYNAEQLRKQLGEEDSSETDTSSKIILRMIGESYKDNLEAAVTEVLPKLDGVFAFAVSDNKQIIIVRDRIGLRQFYYHTNGELAAFSTEKKPLMQLSDDWEGIQRLLPGHMAIIDKGKIRIKQFWSPESLRSEFRISDKEKALAAYDKAIKSNISKRIAGQKRVGVIFSGGIDSLLVAYLVQKSNTPFTCYTSGLSDAVDIQWARKIASQLNFPIKVRTLTIDEIEKLLPQVMRIIEDHSVNQVEAAIAFFTATQLAYESGERIILSGQGPDEIFGGYRWYPAIVDQEGYESFERYSWEDTVLGYKETFERENKIAMAHGLEMIVPYTDPEVIKMAFQISPELKIQKGDTLKKRIHREYAVSIGVPKEIAFRGKLAAQHGSNIHNALQELACRQGFTDSMLREAGYDYDQSVVEILGSSSRYGFRYGNPNLWKPSLQMQYYLDSCAAGLNMLAPKAQNMWEETRQNLQAKRMNES